MYFWISESATDAIVVNSNGIKTLLANGWITFFINGKSGFSNGPISLPRNPSDCINLYIWVFNSLILTD